MEKDELKNELKNECEEIMDDFDQSEEKIELPEVIKIIHDKDGSTAARAFLTGVREMLLENESYDSLARYKYLFVKYGIEMG